MKKRRGKEPKEEEEEADQEASAVIGFRTSLGAVSKEFYVREICTPLVFFAG